MLSMPKDQFQIHPSFPDELKGLAEAIAYIYGKRHGKKGSPTKLFTSVVQGDYLLFPNQVQWDENRLKHILAILDRLREQEQAEQPFLLHYKTGKGFYKHFQVHYVEVVIHEKRMYVDAWVAELFDQTDIPELAHNRCFRLDRIESIGANISGEWRNGLDSLEVLFELRGDLAHGSYEKRPGDRLEFVENVLHVSRSITNYHWFQREIVPYGGNCVVLLPKIVRDKIKTVFKQGLSSYEDKS